MIASEGAKLFQLKKRTFLWMLSELAKELAMLQTNLITEISARAEVVPLPLSGTCPYAAIYRRFILHLEEIQEAQRALVTANRQKYDYFYDSLRDVNEVDRELIAPGVAEIVDRIEAGALEVTIERQKLHDVFCSAAEAKMAAIAQSMRGRPESIGELAIEAFEILRFWRKHHLDQRDVDLLPLFDQRGIGTGASASIFERCFATWVKNIDPKRTLAATRNEVLSFLAVAAPGLAHGHIHMSLARSGFSPTNFLEAHRLFGQSRAHSSSAPRPSAPPSAGDGHSLRSPDPYVEAALAAGFRHGGDFSGFWYDAQHFDSWKAAASCDDAATYATAREVCESEGIEVVFPQPALAAPPLAEDLGGIII